MLKRKILTIIEFLLGNEALCIGIVNLVALFLSHTIIQTLYCILNQRNFKRSSLTKYTDIDDSNVFSK